MINPAPSDGMLPKTSTILSMGVPSSVAMGLPIPPLPPAGYRAACKTALHKKPALFDAGFLCSKRAAAILGG